MSVILQHQVINTAFVTYIPKQIPFANEDSRFSTVNPRMHTKPRLHLLRCDVSQGLILPSIVLQ
jgi:hypothetical protein